jgi:type IV pilus assembly protein PilP
MRLSRVGCVALSAALCSGLTGCGDGGVQEVSRWMDDVKRDTKVVIPKVAEPQQLQG